MRELVPEFFFHSRTDDNPQPPHLTTHLVVARRDALPQVKYQELVVILLKRAKALLQIAMGEAPAGGPARQKE